MGLPKTGSIATGTSSARGSLLGLFIGDALAMPVHWYYDRDALERDYGEVRDFVAPRNPHPDSILWRSAYTPPNEKGDILHDQARFWGQRGVHYHQFLRAGENTLNLKVASLLVDSLLARGDYDPDDWLRRYVAFMTTPGSHRDTYLEECHRAFFTNYALGRDLRECGAKEKHVGGLPGIVPIVVFFRRDPDRARAAAIEHLGLTHTGPRIRDAAELLVDLLLAVLAGEGLRETIEAAVERWTSPLLRHPFRRWRNEPDRKVVGRRLSPACYVEDAVPAVVHLALRYHDDPEAGLVMNTMLGGDNAHRGAVLGALLGAANGEESLPARWREGLVEPPADLSRGPDAPPAV